MTFDEFFKKKRIDLVALKQHEPALFSEFETHYNQMGEKSFDHTKKYWFNKMRRRFPLAVEVKTEKPHIANPLAEQTITESLIEIVPPAASPKIGFTPKFRAGSMPKPPAEGAKEESAPVIESIPTEKPAGAGEPKSAYQPRFKMKPDVEESTLETKEKEPVPQKPAAAAKPAYKPRFNIKAIPPKAEE